MPQTEENAKLWDVMTASEDKGVWVLAEYHERELADVSLELASEGKRLADKLRQELCAVLIGTGIPTGLAGKFRDSGINRLMLVDGPGLEETVELRVQALSEMVREAKPGILLCSTTIFGREMAARLAAALKTGLAPNCLSLDYADDGRLQSPLSEPQEEPRPLAHAASTPKGRRHTERPH